MRKIITRAYHLFARIGQFCNYQIWKRSFFRKAQKATFLVDLDGYSRVCQYPHHQDLSEGIRRNALYPAGVAYRFKTKARKLTFSVLYKKRNYLLSLSPFETACIDVYKKRDANYFHILTIGPTGELDMQACGDVFENEECENEFLLYLCSYAQIRALAVYADAPVEMIAEGGDGQTIAVYGSSITQGCAATRPGLNYANIISRETNSELKNYGFSESAQGEGSIAELISGEHAQIYVLEYDHNATVERLAQTHFGFYERIRKENPKSFIVLMSRFSGGLSISNDETAARKDIIKRTFDLAIEAGDDKVCFIDGGTLPEELKGQMFADDRHPNDSGMRFIADLILEQLRASGYIDESNKRNS